MARFTLIDQFFDDAGNPLIEGKLYFYQSGSSTVEKDTFADTNLTTQNPNPVLLTAAGRVPDIFFSGSARVVLTDKNDAQRRVWEPVGGESEQGSFASWNSQTIYSVPDIVTASDNNYYESITDDNQGNDPTSSPSAWSQVKFAYVWNTNQVYAAGDIAQGTDGLLYSSITSSNQGNDPTADVVNWKPAAAADVPAVIRAAAKTYAYNNF